MLRNADAPPPATYLVPSSPVIDFLRPPVPTFGNPSLSEFVFDVDFETANPAPRAPRGVARLDRTFDSGHAVLKVVPPACVLQMVEVFKLFSKKATDLTEV